MLRFLPAPPLLANEHADAAGAIAGHEQPATIYARTTTTKYENSNPRIIPNIVQSLARHWAMDQHAPTARSLPSERTPGSGKHRSNPAKPLAAIIRRASRTKPSRCYPPFQLKTTRECRARRQSKAVGQTSQQKPPHHLALNKRWNTQRDCCRDSQDDAAEKDQQTYQNRWQESSATRPAYYATGPDPQRHSA